VKTSSILKTLAATLCAGLVFTTVAAGENDACGAADQSVGLESGTHSLLNQGLQRPYRIYVPAGYDGQKPSRLLLWFHGWGGNENELLQFAEITAIADRHSYIVVAPRGLGSGSPDNSYNSWSFSGSNTGLDGDHINPVVPGDTAAICDPVKTPDYRYASCKDMAANSCAWTHCQADDVDFALALLEEISSKLCVDPKNVFAGGGSNGGMFAWELAQNAKSAAEFRAIAPVIGLPHRGYLSGPGRTGDFPLLLITGTLDDTVPPGSWGDDSFTTTTNDSDRFYYTGATAIMKVWAAAHACDVDQAAKLFDAGEAQAECRTYCEAGAAWPLVADCRAVMGHEYGLAWSFELMLDFFDAHAAQQ
jgi:polyhydroxybutyrate depolymerase